MKTTQKLKVAIARFKLLKRVEKRLNDKMDTLRASIMEQAGGAPCVIEYGDEKLASIVEVLRSGTDKKAMEKKYPELVAEYAKTAEKFATESASLQLRLH